MSTINPVPIIDLKRQYKSIKNEIDPVLNAVLESGSFVLGENVSSFEKAVADFCGVGFAVGVASGTDALELSLRALGIGKGDEVITTPFTFIATVEAIYRIGAVAVFADIDPLTFNLNPQCFREKITERTRAVIPVHLYGCPAEMERFITFGASGIKIIEDCAQAFGAVYSGRKVGAWGDCGCFSFFPTKNLGANGDGGMVVTNSRDVADRLLLLRSHGSRQRYHHLIHGYNSRLDEIQAAVLNVKLKHLSAWNEARRSLADIYKRKLKSLEESGKVVLPSAQAASEHVYCLYTIRAKEREALAEFLKSRGIHTAVHYPVPLHMQEVYSELGYKKGDFPESEKAAAEVISLPLFPEMTCDEAEQVVVTMVEFYDKHNNKNV